MPLGRSPGGPTVKLVKGKILKQRITLQCQQHLIDYPERNTQIEYFCLSQTWAKLGISKVVIPTCLRERAP